MMGSRDGKVNVQIWIERGLVKRLDHARIDLGVRSRSEMVERVIAEWLASQQQPGTGEGS